MPFDPKKYVNTGATSSSMHPTSPRPPSNMGGVSVGLQGAWQNQQNQRQGGGGLPQGYQGPTGPFQGMQQGGGSTVPSLQDMGFNLPGGLDKSERRNLYNTMLAMQGMNMFPSQREAISGYDPMQFYGGVMGGAQGALTGYFNGGAGGGYNPQQNPFLNMGQQMLGREPGQYGYNMQGLPQTPGLTGAPTQYNAPQMPGMQMSGAGGPRLSPIGQMQQFDPSSVQGPNVGQVGVQQVASNLQLNTPGFAEALQAAQGVQGAGSLPREQLQQQQFGVDPMAQQAFGAGLEAQKNLAGTSATDTMAGMQGAMDKVFERAAQAGYNRSGASGFDDPRGSMAGIRMGEELGAAASQMAPQVMSNMLQAQGQALGAQQAGAAGLTGLGSAAAGATQGTQGLNLQGMQGVNQGNIAQRGQDLQSLLSGQGSGAANINAISNLIGTLNQGQLGAGSQSLQAALANQQAGLQAGTANQNAGLQGYGLQTGRMGELGGLQNQYNQMMGNFGLGQQQNEIGAYNAQTGRQEGQNQFTLGAGNLGLGFGNLGLGYDTLGAQNQNQYNQQLADLYGTQGSLINQANQIGGNFANQQWGNAIDQWGTGMQGAGNLAGIYQQGGQFNQQMDQQRAALAAQLLGGGAQTMTQVMGLQQAAAGGDQNAQMQLNQLYSNLHLGREMNAGQGGGIGGAIGGIVGGIAGSALGPFGAMAGNYLGNQVFGGGQQQQQQQQRPQ